MILRNGPPGDPHGLTVDWRRISASSFPFRIQQVPGEKNALGRLKLEMPNRLQVYLHDTPAKALFSQPERFVSHGCIRVQETMALAQYALTGDPASDVARLIQPGSDTRRLPLEKPLKVYVLYWTVFRGEDGTVAFRNDVYGRDAQLIAALSNKRITLSKPSQTECSA
jgi:murein L,D-transpeptidase YcbB/YkuD